MKSVSIEKIAELMKNYDEYRIIYHVRPDGDCIGSAYGLALALQSIGKCCDVSGEYPVPEAYKYLTDHFKRDEVTKPIYIAIDSASPDRLGIYQSEKYTFCIDHHHDNSVIAEFKYVETDCGACSEIIVKLIDQLGTEMTKEMADLLYMALITDTMCFRTYDVTKQSFETAVRLADKGADICEIARKHMFLKSPERLRLEGLLRSSFRFSCDSRILTGIIMLDDLKEAGIPDSELEGINSLVDEADCVDIGVTIRELPDRSLVRCSMRTKGNISANEICKIHGGGGHYHAAACFLPNVTVFQARDIIESTCKKYLEEN